MPLWNLMRLMLWIINWDKIILLLLRQILERRKYIIYLEKEDLQKIESLKMRCGPKIGIFNDVGKYKIDSRAPRNVESTMDLRKFGVNVQLDLRRNHYKAKILKCMSVRG